MVTNDECDFSDVIVVDGAKHASPSILYEIVHSVGNTRTSQYISLKHSAPTN